MAYIIHQDISEAPLCMYDVIHIATNGLYNPSGHFKISLCIYDVIHIATSGIYHPSGHLYSEFYVRHRDRQITMNNERFG